MPTFYNYTEGAYTYNFDDVFVPADFFRSGGLWLSGGFNDQGQLGNNTSGGFTNASTPITTFAGGLNWRQCSAGGYHSGAIKTDGTLWMWGFGGSLGDQNNSSRSTPITTFAGGTDWKQVSCGTYHTGAIKTDGTLWMWGQGSLCGVNDPSNNTKRTPVTTITGGSDWKQVNCGDEYSIAIKIDGTLWIWGTFIAPSGKGPGYDFEAFTPITTFVGGTTWADTATGLPEELYTISTSGQHSAAIKTDGTLWTWGYNVQGQLGYNNTDNQITPVPSTTFAGGTNWKQVCTGSSHTAAIKTDGTLWTWGQNFYGALGTNDTNNRLTPVTTFLGGTNWKQVSASSHTAAIKTDGTLWVWGDNSGRQIGNLSSVTQISIPVTTFAGGTNWKQVSASNDITAAIKTDGTLWIWGYNNNGNLGNNSTGLYASTPVTTFAGGINWKQVGGRIAIKTDGTLWTWGQNFNGDLGNASNTGSSTPVTTFAGGTNWKQVNGQNSIAAIKTDGTLWTWGYGSRGSLGINSGVDRNTPVTTFLGGTNWLQCNMCSNNLIALRNTGVGSNLLYMSGADYQGQLGKFFSPNSNYVPQQTFAGGSDWNQGAVGSGNFAAIKTDGTLWTWGLNGNGQCGTNDGQPKSTPVTTFAGGTNWKQVDCGQTSIMAIKTDGTLWGMGQNVGNLTGGTPATPVTTFAGGNDWKKLSIFGFLSSTGAIKSNGTLWVWGSNDGSRLGTNSTQTSYLTPVTTFAGGTNWKQINCGYHLMAITYHDSTI